MNIVNKRLRYPACLLLGTVLALAGMFLAGGQAWAQGRSGTTLSATKTADEFLKAR